MKTIHVEVIARVLTSYDHCRRYEVIFNQMYIGGKIHRQDFNDYPQDVKEEFLRLCDWVRELARLYKHRIFIRVIDAHSPMGILKSLWHKVWKYPAFIVEGKDKYVGWDTENLEVLIDRHL